MVSGWDEIDWDIDEGARKCCPICDGVYMEEEKKGLTRFSRRIPHFFNHSESCEARTIPTDTMLRLHQDETRVRAEVARLNGRGTT
jgi:hypothetical protein